MLVQVSIIKYFKNGIFFVVGIFQAVFCAATEPIGGEGGHGRVGRALDASRSEANKRRAHEEKNKSEICFLTARHRKTPQN